MGVLRLRGSLALSFLFHAAFAIAWILLFSKQATYPPVKKFTVIEVEPWSTSRRDQAEKKSQADQSKRIVQTEAREKSKDAAPDAFLGQQNQKVAEQTVSRSRSTLSGGAESSKAYQQKMKQKALSGAKNLLSKLGVGLPLFQQKNTTSESRMNPKWAIGGEAVPSDYVKGLKESDQTLLNTKEYVFYGYFQRIRSRLDRAWTVSLREKVGKLYRNGRRLASETDHRTRTLVTLNSSGEIIRVQVLEESGVRDLDDAAIKAFNEAGPFPHPPNGIVNSRGQVEILWEFVLKT